MLGPVNDAEFRLVTDLGITGPDQGKGGSTCSSPGYSGELPPDGYFVPIPSKTYNLVGFYSAFVENGDIGAAVTNVKANAKVYPLPAAANPSPSTFSNISGMQLNTIQANDYSFYEQLNAGGPGRAGGCVRSRGRRYFFVRSEFAKGTPFEPNDKMKEILSDAASVGNATARALLFSPRSPRGRSSMRIGSGGTLTSAAATSSSTAGARLLDARTAFHYYATGITPSMVDVRPDRVGFRLRGARQQGRVSRRRQDLQNHPARPGPGGAPSGPSSSTIRRRARCFRRTSGPRG